MNLGLIHGDANEDNIIINELIDQNELTSKTNYKVTGKLWGAMPTFQNAFFRFFCDKLPSKIGFLLQTYNLTLKKYLKIWSRWVWKKYQNFDISRSRGTKMFGNIYYWMTHAGVPIFVKHWGDNLQFYPNFALFSILVGWTSTTIFSGKQIKWRPKKRSWRKIKEFFFRNLVKTKTRSNHHPAYSCRPESNYWGGCRCKP